MVENCSHNCEGCTENCSERTKESFLEKPNEMSHIKKVIGVVSGKGGARNLLAFKPGQQLYDRQHRYRRWRPNGEVSS